MYTQKTANIFDHIQDHSRLGLQNKFLENKSRRIFFRSTGLLCKFLPTNLGVFKPIFYNFYTSHLRWNSTIYHTDFGENTVFQNFSRKIAFSQFSGRSLVGFKRNRSKISKITHTASWFSFLSASCQCGRVFEWTLIELRFNIIASLLLLFFCYLMVSVITMCNLIKRLIRASTFFSIPASDFHERWKQTAQTSD